MAATKTAKKSPARKTAKKTAAPKTATAKKTTAKKATAKKAPAKKTTKKAPAAKKTTGPVELTKSQKRVLVALLAAPSGLSGKEIATKAKINASLVGNIAGYRKDEINDRPVHKNNLRNRKHVTIAKEDGVWTYRLTAAGKKAAETAKKEK